MFNENNFGKDDQIIPLGIPTASFQDMKTSILKGGTTVGAEVGIPERNDYEFSQIIMNNEESSDFSSGDVLKYKKTTKTHQNTEDNLKKKEIEFGTNNENIQKINEQVQISHTENENPHKSIKKVCSSDYFSHVKHNNNGEIKAQNKNSNPTKDGVENNNEIEREIDIDEDLAHKKSSNSRSTNQPHSFSTKDSFRNNKIDSISPFQQISFNLRKYSDYDDPTFDYETAQHNIPLHLLLLIVHSKISIVFKAICGVSLNSYPSDIVSAVLDDINIYLQICKFRNMDAECKYLLAIIESIKNHTDFISQLQKSAKNEERFKEMEKQYQEELSNLSKTWISEQKLQKYYKPSQELIALQKKVKANLDSKNFEEATKLSMKAEALDNLEKEQKLHNLKKAYQDQVKYINKRYEEMKNELYNQFDGEKRRRASQSTVDSHLFMKNPLLAKDRIEISQKNVNVLSRGNPISSKKIIKAPKISASMDVTHSLSVKK